MSKLGNIKINSGGGTTSSFTKVIWIGIILLILFFWFLIRSYNEVETRISKLENKINDIEEVIYGGSKRTSKSGAIDSRLVELEGTVQEIKGESCASLSRLFELNGKVYFCPIGW